MGEVRVALGDGDVELVCLWFVQDACEFACNLSMPVPVIMCQYTCVAGHISAAFKAHTAPAVAAAVECQDCLRVSMAMWFTSFEAHGLVGFELLTAAL